MGSAPGSGGGQSTHTSEGCTGGRVHPVHDDLVNAASPLIGRTSSDGQRLGLPNRDFKHGRTTRGIVDYDVFTVRNTRHRAAAPDNRGRGASTTARPRARYGVVGSQSRDP